MKEGKKSSGPIGPADGTWGSVPEPAPVPQLPGGRAGGVPSPVRTPPPTPAPAHPEA